MTDTSNHPQLFCLHPTPKQLAILLEEPAAKVEARGDQGLDLDPGETADALDHNRQCLLADRRLTHPLADKARAALAEPDGPTLQLPEQAPDEHPPSNLNRREVAAWYHGHACGWQAARAGRARYGHPPAPPADGEVAGLVAALRADAECAEVEHSDLCSMTADQMRRAADLLERRQTAPVPVAWCNSGDFLAASAKRQSLEACAAAVSSRALLTAEADRAERGEGA